jgi:hypothetical protein
MIFRWSSRNVGLIVFGACVIAALGLVLVAVEDEIGAKILGGVWAAIFLALGLALLYRSRDRNPVVSIDADGIYDRRICDRVISWDDIRRVDTLEADQMSFVAIDLKPGAKIFAQLNFLHRLMRWPNRLLGFPALSIAMHALDGSTSDLLTAIRGFRPDLVHSE